MHLTFIISAFYVALQYEFCGILSDPLLLDNNTFVWGKKMAN